MRKALVKAVLAELARSNIQLPARAIVDLHRIVRKSARRSLDVFVAGMLREVVATDVFGGHRDRVGSLLATFAYGFSDREFRFGQWHATAHAERSSSLCLCKLGERLGAMTTPLGH